jgi:capsular polysaccharide transport system permease protein
MTTEVNNSFLEKALVQIRVIKALMTRELLTEFGRKNIGFFWIFLEPIIFISLIMFLRDYILGSNKGAQAVEHHIPLTGFLLTGYVLFMLIRRGLSFVGSSATSNKGIMYHANVKTSN